MAKTKKAFSAKRVLALALALIMALSVMPAAFAATPTGPVSKTEGNLVNGVDAGHYVSFRANLQNFTFIQTEDNQNFQFQFRLDAKKNLSANYCWIYERQDRAPQTLSTPIGKSFSVTWDSYQEASPTVGREPPLPLILSAKARRCMILRCVSPMTDVGYR